VKCAPRAASACRFGVGGLEFFDFGSKMRPSISSTNRNRMCGELGGAGRVGGKVGPGVGLDGEGVGTSGVLLPDVLLHSTPAV
jgi:hypothetical protein